MTTLLPLICLLHFILIGIILARRGVKITLSSVSTVFLYFVAFHGLLAIILVLFPGFVDPR